MICDIKAKSVACAERKEEIKKIDQKITALEKAYSLEQQQEYAGDSGSASASGCAAFFRRFFGRKGQHVSISNEHHSGARTSLDVAMFGQKAAAHSSAASAASGAGAGAHMAASERLKRAADAMHAHAESLEQRANASREQARELMASGRKSEALHALKRAKHVEKQLANALATHAALERQLDVLEESELQQQVAQALTASVASAKVRLCAAWPFLSVLVRPCPSLSVLGFSWPCLALLGFA